MRLANKLSFVLAVVLAPGFALAAGGGDSSPPKPTNTTKECKGVRVWDEDKGRCVRPKESRLDSDRLYAAVRELAYAGRYLDAQGVLTAMPDQTDDRVLTYWGFTHRKMGETGLADSYYQRAIDRNPDNLLARSYMGQGMVASGDLVGAYAQWREIRDRGGEGSWAETALRSAIETGTTYSY